MSAYKITNKKIAFITFAFCLSFPSLSLAANYWWYSTGADAEWTTLTGNWWTDVPTSHFSATPPSKIGLF